MEIIMNLIRDTMELFIRRGTLLFSFFLFGSILELYFAYKDSNKFHFYKGIILTIIMTIGLILSVLW